MGPRTGAIENLFVGPFWYLVIAPGYLLFNGNPWGAVWVMVFLNALLIILTFWFLGKYLSPTYSFLITLGLIVFERFWFTAQFALNPHLLPVLTTVLAISLVLASQGKKYWLFFASFFTGMVIHSELAFAPVAFLTFFFTAVYLLKKGKISLKILLLSLGLFFIFLLPHLVSEINNNFLQTQAVLRAIGEPTGVIGKTAYWERLVWITKEFLNLFGQAIVPQSPIIGSLLFIFLLIFFAYQYRKFNKSLSFLLLLTSFLVIVSIFWFSLSKEFLPWHILGVYSLIYLVIMLSLAFLKTRLALVLFFLILVAQITNFLKTYPGQLKATSDQGLYINQLKAIDWVYKEANNEGFNVYNYLQFVYDYPYQYTIWWRGTKKYGYLPCEYSTYPNTPSSLYFSGIEYFQEPKKECTKTRFLIIEPTTDQSGFASWYQGVTLKTELQKQETFGKVKVEKRTLL